MSQEPSFLCKLDGETPGFSELHSLRMTSKGGTKCALVKQKTLCRSKSLFAQVALTKVAETDQSQEKGTKHSSSNLAARGVVWGVISNHPIHFPGDSDWNSRLGDTWIRVCLEIGSHPLIRYLEHAEASEDRNNYKIRLRW